MSTFPCKPMASQQYAVPAGTTPRVLDRTWGQRQAPHLRPSPSHSPSRFTYSLATLSLCGHLPSPKASVHSVAQFPCLPVLPLGSLTPRLPTLQAPHSCLPPASLSVSALLSASRHGHPSYLASQPLAPDTQRRLLGSWPPGQIASAFWVCHLQYPCPPLLSAGPSSPQGPSPANLLTATLTLYTFFLPTKHPANCCHSHLETSLPLCS